MLHMAMAAKFNLSELSGETLFGKGWIFEGHGSAWAKDLGGNVLQKGCFVPSIESRVPDRMIKIRWLHDLPMGFVIDAKEDDVGLWIKAFVPQTNDNAERIQLMQAGVVDKLSIGFDPDFSTVTYTETQRNIGMLTLYEVSPVDLPLNEATGIDSIVAMRLEDRRRRTSMGAGNHSHTINIRNIGRVSPKKTFTVNQPIDLAFADIGLDYNQVDALARVQDYYKVTDTPNADFDNAFIYIVPNSNDVAGRVLPIVDIIDTSQTVSEPLIIPAAVDMAASIIYEGTQNQDILNNLGIAVADVPAIKTVIDAYYTRMADTFNDPTLVSPWNADGVAQQEGEDNVALKNRPKQAFIGATLNAANLALLQQAVDNISKVLSSAAKENNSSDKFELTFEDSGLETMLASLANFTS
jgi:HK97 family phage prohead protease